MAAAITLARRIVAALRPDRIGTRITLTMVAAMLLAQVVGYLLFRGDHDGWWPIPGLDAAIARVRAPVEAAAALPPAERPDVLGRFANADLSLSYHPRFAPVQLVRSSGPLDRFSDHLARALSGVVDQVLIEGGGPVRPPLLGGGGEPDRPLTLWLRLKDGSWITATLLLGDVVGGRPLHALMPWVVTFVAILVIGLASGRSISRSLRRLADAAERLGTNIAVEPLAEKGPREIRALTRAFNDMQHRLRRFVDDRTQMLASVSHDLRTPLSRLKLRTEDMPDHASQPKMLADLDLMDRMIAATLSFARDDVASERRLKIDLASLVQTICDECADAGGDVSYEGPDRLAVEAAPTALQRAITNVVENAVKYGGATAVRLSVCSKGIEIAVRDRGPGIPEEMQERVFEPFFRLDAARTPGADMGTGGGTGLGLAIARHVLRAHGGDIQLANGTAENGDGGLIVRLLLPTLLRRDT